MSRSEDGKDDVILGGSWETDWMYAVVCISLYISA